MSRSTRLGTGSVSKIDYQKLSSGTIEPQTSVSMYYLNPNTSPKKPKVQSTPKAPSSHKKENGMVRHLHAKRRIQDYRFNWPCLQCGFQQLSSEMDLAQHLDICEGIPQSGSFVPGFNGIQLECPLCTANEFPYLQDLDSHLIVCHAEEIEGDGPFICKYCDLNFNTLLPLVQHKLIYHQIYPNIEYETPDLECKCSGCNSLFQSENDLCAHYEECIQQEEEDPDNPVANCPGLVVLEPLSYLEPVTSVLKGSEYLPQLSDEQHKRNNDLTTAFEAKFPLARIGLRMYDSPSTRRPSPYKTTDWTELSRPIQPKSKVASEKLALLNKKKAEQMKKKQSEVSKKKQNMKQSELEEDEDLISGPLQVGSITFSCSQCNSKFSSQPNLQKHVIQAHAEFGKSSLDDTINNVLSNLESLPQLQFSPPNESEIRTPTGSPVKQTVSRSEEEISPGRTGFMNKMKKIHDLKRTQREEQSDDQVDHYNFDAAQEDALNPEDVATFEDFMKNLQTETDEQPAAKKSKKLSVPKKPKSTTLKNNVRPLKSLSRPLKTRPVVTPKIPFSQIGQAGGIYSCPLCMESFDLLRSRDDHLREQHNGERVFACQICGVSFSLYGFLNAHCKRVHSDNLEWALYGDPEAESMPHECNYCTVAFFTTSVLKSHVQIMHPDAPKPTRGRRSKKQMQMEEEAKLKAAEESRSSANLVRRHNEMTGASYLCTECSAEFPDEIQVRQHMMQEHPPSDEESHHMVKANNHSMPNYHEYVPDDESKEQEIPTAGVPSGAFAPMCCIICQDEIHNPLEFEIHFASHVSSPQSLGCQLCGRVFTGPNARQNLSDHSQIDHRGLAPYSCSKCPGIFSLQHDLMRHRIGGQCRSLDIPPDTLEDVVVYGCPACGKYFAGDEEKYRLEEHKLVHLEEAATSDAGNSREDSHNNMPVVMQGGSTAHILSVADWDKENQHQVMLMYQEEGEESGHMEDSDEHLIMSDDNSRV